MDPFDEEALGFQFPTDENDYNAPDIVTAPSALDFEGLDLLQDAFGGDVLGAPLNPALGIRNTPYGRVVITHTSANAGEGEDRVPVYDIQLVIDTNTAQNEFDFAELARYVFSMGYNAALSVAQQAQNPNDYAQIRLFQDAANSLMSFDLTSDMLPVDAAIEDFINTYLLMLQSDPEDAARSKVIQVNRTTLRFHFTFVLSNQGNAVVGPQNYPTVVRHFRTSAEVAEQRATASDETLSRRYLVQEALFPQGRVGRVGHPAFQNRVAAANARRVMRRYEQRVNFDANQLGPELLEMPLQAVEAGPEMVPAQMNGPNSRRRPRWSDEQRQRYNENRRIARRLNVANAEVRGVYDDLKRRIFHHASIDDFFTYSKAVDNVPTTWEEGYCLSMAFMHSEMRVYTLGEELTIEESTPNLVVSEEHNYVTCPLSSQSRDLIGRESPFICGDEIVLFNPYKKTNSTAPDRIGKYAPSLSTEEIQTWYRCAVDVHRFVVEQCGHDLDPNDETSLQEYSDVFGVYIFVYRAEVQGKRTNFYKPYNEPDDIRQSRQISVVSILVGNRHATAITSLREFMKTKVSANRSTLYNYCVICEKTATANNENIAESRKHFAACLAKHKGKITCQGDTKSCEQVISNVSPTQFVFRKKRKGKDSDESVYLWCCKLCAQEVVGGVDGQMDHVCYIQKPDTLKIGREEDIYVYDMECAQIFDAAKNVFVHKVNLVCVRRAYPNAEGSCDRHDFSSLKGFMEYIMKQTQQNRVYLAHNGSKYDVQFIMQYLEANLIPHSFVPTPSSMHAYLSVTIAFGADVKSTFIDFRHFMPGSLKNIGLAFGLSVAKGDFPHRFNNGSNDHFCGALPIVDSPDDYWCLQSKRTQEDVDEFHAWYEEQTALYCTCASGCICTKKKWDFQEEILKYCWLDVDVLAEACVKYRDNALEFGVGEESNEGWVSKGIDPFQYLTIPQLALNLLLAGSPEEERISITLPKIRRERVSLAIAWMERQRDELQLDIQHMGNSHREYFCPRSKRFLDGVVELPTKKHIFVCLNCSFHGCPECYYDEIQTGSDHPMRPGTYSLVYRDTETFVKTLLEFYGVAQCHIVWQHDLTNYTYFEQQLGNVMKERDMFYGGRTEVFSPYANADMYYQEDIKYHDVCSLYPYVCAFKPLPTGHPVHLLGKQIDMTRLVDLNHPDPYFGFVRCTVLPNPQDIIGFLPHRDPKTGRLEFPLYEMTGSWGTEELRVALESGYRITALYEVYHWEREERSDTLLRGYVSFFLRMKQEAEGWRKLGACSETPDEEEQLEVQERVYRESGCIARIRCDKVAKNPVRRQMAKLFLNSLWGKFCQKPHCENYTVIHGKRQFYDIWSNPNLDKSKFSFRHLSGNTWKVKYCTLDDFTKPNAKYNIFLSSKVTEWARCILHRQMKKIGPQRILYCDTDSLMFIWPSDAPKLDGVGLGNWVDEYPRAKIRRLYALAPKFYYLDFYEDEPLLKSKGIQVTLGNSQLIHSDSLGLQLLEIFFPKEDKDGNILPFTGHLRMKNMIMGINSTNATIGYGAMTTRYTDDKRLGPVFSKREVVKYLQRVNVPYNARSLDKIQRIYSFPKGYFLPLEELSETCYSYIKINELV